MADTALFSALTPWIPSFSLPLGDAPIAVACSGGPDSLALLALTAAAGHRAVAIHVDHGLRPESAAEAEVVGRAAELLGALWRSARVHVGEGPGLEARARSARYAALEAQADAAGAHQVLLGHTSDDQAETVLLNLLRGAATSGLSGMPPRRGRFVRPILGLSRADTVEICARLGLTPVLDPMNDDVGFRRVWLRREVLPLLEAGTGRDLRALLARQATIMRSESEFLDDLAGRELEAAAVTPGAPLPARVVAGLDDVLARRVVRAWVGAPPPSSGEVERVIQVARRAARATQLAGGVRVERSRGMLRRRVGAGAGEPTVFDLPGAGSGGAVSVETWVERGAPVAWPDGAWTCVLDADVAGDRAVVQPGESVEPDVVAARMVDPTGAPLWDVGYRVATRARVTSTTRRYLWARASIDERERA